jgi:hypothetical protein
VAVAGPFIEGDRSDERLAEVPDSVDGDGDLIAAIEDCIAHHNADPRPYNWTKTAQEIIEKVRRGRVVLQRSST